MQHNFSRGLETKLSFELREEILAPHFGCWEEESRGPMNFIHPRCGGVSLILCQALNQSWIIFLDILHFRYGTNQHREAYQSYPRN